MTATTMIAAEPEQARARIQSVNRRILLGAWRMPSFRIGFFIFVALLLISAVYPEVSSVSATKMIVKDKFLPPLFPRRQMGLDSSFGAPTSLAATC